MDLIVAGDGLLRADLSRLRVTLGRSGISASKREGDGATPAGIFSLREVLYRADRLAAPVTGLPVSPIGESDGWCDDPSSPDYNRRVDLPHPASCERLWREDELYDLVIVVGYNDDPVVPGSGSAIFVHVAAPDGSPTEGCVALARADLRSILADLGPDSRLIVESS